MCEIVGALGVESDPQVFLGGWVLVLTPEVRFLYTNATCFPVEFLGIRRLLRRIRGEKPE